MKNDSKARTEATALTAVAVAVAVAVAAAVATAVAVVVVYPKSICSTDPLRGIDCRFAVRPTHLGGGDSRRMANTR